MKEIKVKGQGIAPLVKQLRVKVRTEALSGLEIYNTEGIAGDGFDVIALGIHRFGDGSQEAVAFLDTPEGIREVALKHCLITERK